MAYTFDTPVQVASPTLNVDQIRAALAGSPLESYAQDIYDLGGKYQMDPAFLLAISKFESNYMRVGGEPGINNVGGIVCVDGGQFGQVGCKQLGTHSFAVYPDIQTGIEAVYRLVALNYFPRGQQTLGDILFGKGGDVNTNGSTPGYAPPWSQPGVRENPVDYYNNLLGFINGLYTDIIPPFPITIKPKPAPNANPNPVVDPNPKPAPSILPNVLSPITDITTAIAAIPTAITNAIISIEKIFWIIIGVVLILAGLLLLVESSKQVQDTERTVAVDALAA